MAVLRSCVAIAHGMEACTEHLLVHFKQHAVIGFLTFKGVSPAEIHWLFMVMTVDISSVHHWAKTC